ncbi:MAG: BamA/TamA family outer membrane protein [Prevotellaceae bacterium]|nr:BamA/TamA family outer membrane protein [Prevotellaceae bacterium]
MTIKKTIITISILFLLISCSLTKYVPENRTLLNSTKVRHNNTGMETGTLNSYLLQSPNSRMLGFMRTRLMLYSMSSRDTVSRFNRFLKNIGEEPVVFDSVVAWDSKESINQALINKGFLDSKVNLDIFTKKKKTNLAFDITSGEPYKIRYFNFAINNDTILDLLNRNYTINSLQGEMFDVDKLNELRGNISNMLRRRGYYNVQKDMFAFTADTTDLNHQVDVKLIIQEQFAADSVANVIFRKKQIDRVFLYCFTDREVQSENYTSALDTVMFDGYTIIYNDRRHIFTPEFLASKVFLRTGQSYNERLAERTASNLNSLQAIKYVSVNFTEKDSNLLDCSVVVSPSEKYSYSVDVEGTTNSGSTLGARVNFGFTNKNIFHGAETFKLGAFASYDAYKQDSSIFYNAFTAGGETSLTFPKLLVPFLKDDARLRYGVSTTVSANYSYQNHPDFKRTVANAKMGYRWQRRNSHYTFDIVNLSYIKVPYINPDFKDKFSALRHSYEDHMILKMGFNYSISNIRTDLSKQNYYAFKGDIETSGNIFYSLSKITKQNMTDGKYQIFNTPYSQFVKGDFDYSYNFYLDNNARLVLHANLGLGFPYGNATVLPFEERYFCGGSNSMRGWDARTLGPGVFTTGKLNSFLLQNGDIKFEMNAETRFKLFWVLEGAVFVDAGNVWTIREYKDQQGGQFSFKNGQFLEQIAVNYGAGLRFDFSFFLIRFDLGVKLYDPSFSAGDRWYGFGSDKANPVSWQFAIGYPF